MTRLLHNCTSTSHSFSGLYSTLTVLGGTLHHATIHIFPIAFYTYHCSTKHYCTVPWLHVAKLNSTIPRQYITESYYTLPTHCKTLLYQTLTKTGVTLPHLTLPWQNIIGQSTTWLHCTFTILQDTPLFHTRPPHYTTFYTLPNHTLTSLLKTLQVSTVTARDHILPYFTFTEQKYYPTILSIPLLNIISLNCTSPDRTKPLHYLFQLTITLQYHKLLFSTITKLLTLNNNSTPFKELYSASTLLDRSIQCRYHSALSITSPLQHPRILHLALPHLDHTARYALSHTLPHQHSHSPYFHKPYYAINITLNRITSQYHYKTRYNFTVPLLFDTMQGCTTQYLNHEVLYPC